VATLKEELSKLIKTGAIPVPDPVRPAALSDLSVEGLHLYYAENYENTTITDPRGHRIRFEASNFAYLTKLQFNDPKQKRWVDAKASIVIAQLKAKTFNPDTYRVGDVSRARTISWIKGIIEDPDCIHANNVKGMSDKEIYVKRYQPIHKTDEGIKVVLIAEDARGLIFASSFWSRQGWLRNASKQPAKYVRLNSKGCRCR
jgi:hypothetical protein